MKGVLNMKMKKGIITISTIVVVILGVFFAMRFIGGNESANTQTPNDNVVQSDTTTSTNNNEALTNESEEATIDSNQVEKEVKDTKGVSTNEMDVAYINDKTNVGIYTVKKNDTVFSIVKAYMPNYDKSKVLEFIKGRNSMDASYTITEGQKIVIPYEKAIETSKAVASQTNAIEYTVKKQDTLTSIAKNNMPSYNIKQAIDMLKQENKITDENSIKEGTILYIPKYYL
jgi:hypothetical protein